jgi:hypothetical protein
MQDNIVILTMTVQVIPVSTVWEEYAVVAAEVDAHLIVQDILAVLVIAKSARAYAVAGEVQPALILGAGCGICMHMFALLTDSAFTTLPHAKPHVVAEVCAIQSQGAADRTPMSLAGSVTGKHATAVVRVWMMKIVH